MSYFLHLWYLKVLLGRVVGWHPSFTIYSTSTQVLLDFSIFVEKSWLNLILLPLYFAWSFSLAALIFFLCCMFSVLVLMCQGKFICLVESIWCCICFLYVDRHPLYIREFSFMVLRYFLCSWHGFILLPIFLLFSNLVFS